MSETEKKTADIALVRKFIQECMSRRDLTAAQLSRQTGLKQYTISRLLNGKVNEIELQTAAKLYEVMADGLTSEDKLQLVNCLGLGTLWEALRDGGAHDWIDGPSGAAAGRDTARAMVTEWMERRSVSQAELARRAAVDPSRIGRFLRGEIEAKTAARIFRAVHADFEGSERRVLLQALGLYEMAAALAGLLRGE